MNVRSKQTYEDFVKFLGNKPWKVGFPRILGNVITPYPNKVISKNKMKEITDYGKVFETIVEKTAKYLTDNNIKAQILGISGGIDSTVCAAICHEVSKKTGIPLIGRSLPTTFNKKEETTSADLVGKVFCSNYKVVSINLIYKSLLSFIGTMEDSMLDLSGNTLYDIQGEFPKQQTNLADGNIQARLRMIYLYNLASIHKGLVIDTDNLTEHNLGYWTIHGDVGDFNPIGGLWKTEIFKLAKWLLSYYAFQLPHNMYEVTSEQVEKAGKIFQQGRAIRESLQLKPTAGLGITNNDLEELGAESYEQVDSILQEILAWKELVMPESINFKNFMDDQQILNIPYEIVENVAKRHFNSEFKRNKLPVVINRNLYQ